MARARVCGSKRSLLPAGKCSSRAWSTPSPEAELISALGTVDSGGLLTNSVLPSGLSAKVRASVTVPSGVKEKAQLGLSLLKDSVLELARANAKGISNSDAA